MSRSRLVSVLLLLVLGLTMLSPHFAWEVMAADAHHDRSGAGLVLDAQHDHDERHPLHDHHDEHACGGHMFSHMPVQPSSPAAPALLQARDAFSRIAEPGYPSRDPDALDRPPRPPRV